MRYLHTGSSCGKNIDVEPNQRQQQQQQCNNCSAALSHSCCSCCHHHYDGSCCDTTTSGSRCRKRLRRSNVTATITTTSISQFEIFHGIVVRRRTRRSSSCVLYRIVCFIALLLVVVYNNSNNNNKDSTTTMNTRRRSTTIQHIVVAVDASSSSSSSSSSVVNGSSSSNNNNSNNTRSSWFRRLRSGSKEHWDTFSTRFRNDGNNNNSSSSSSSSSSKNSTNNHHNDNRSTTDSMSDTNDDNGTTAPTTTTTDTDTEYIDDDIDDPDDTRSIASLFFSTSNIMTKKRLQFLDRIAMLASSIVERKDTTAVGGTTASSMFQRQQATHRRTTTTTGTTKFTQMGGDDDGTNCTTTTPLDLNGITPQSDLTRPGRYIHIVTTAALPWFTGTAVNPLLRAAYLHRTTQHINRVAATTTADKMDIHNYNHTTTNGTHTKSKNSKSAVPLPPPRRWVTLVIPWLELPEDQMMLYNGRVFQNCSEQEQYIRDWLHTEANMSDVACPQFGLQIVFYPGRYHPGLGSIFAMGDIIDTIIMENQTNSTTNATGTATTAATTTTNDDDDDDDDHATSDDEIIIIDVNTTSSDIYNNDTILSSSSSLLITTTSHYDDGDDMHHQQLDICVLEEPEHCNWYRAPGDGWTKRFNYVVGIVHTNYKEYASSHYSGLWTAPAIALMSSAMIRAYCHKVIKLSNTLQSYAVEKESTSNVHGVRSNFWQEGLRRSKLQSSSWDDTPSNSTTMVYFIGKLLWAKGLDLMLELEDYYKQYTGEYFPIDIYGSGPDQRAITRAFHGRRNSVNANPKKEAEIEAMDKDDDDNNSNENCNWDENISLTRNNNDSVSAIGDDKNAFWSSGSRGAKSDLYVKAKQTIAQFKATMNTAVDIQEITREQIAKLKDTINNVELPTTFSELRRQPIPANFLGRVDHGTLTSSQYRIFCNPSISEVLCTTTAEALAMGKYAIIPVHPSNTFFLQFPNCLAYRNKFEFVANLRWALTHEPEPLTPEQIHQFTWEAATERFIAASAITWRDALERERLGLAKLDERIAWFHNELGKGETGDFIRKVLGAGPASHQVKYQKEKYDGSATSNEGDTDEIPSAKEDGNDDDDDSDDDEESGFSRKFRQSAFAQAIRAAVKEFSSFGIQ